MSPSISKGTGLSVVIRRWEALIVVKPSWSRPVSICAPKRAQSTTRSGLASMRSTFPSDGEAWGKSGTPAVMVPTLPRSAITTCCSMVSPSSRVTVAVNGSGAAFCTAARA